MMTSKLQFPNSRPSRILTHGSALFSSLFLMMAGGNVDAQDTVIRYNSSGTQTASGTDIYAVQTANGFASGDVIKLSGDVEFNSSQIYVGDGKNSEFLNFTIQSDTPGVKRTIKKVNSGRFYNINYNAGANASITLKDLAYDGTGTKIGNVLGIFMWYTTKNSTLDLAIDNVSFTGFENTGHNAGVLGGFQDGSALNITVSNGLVFDSNKVTNNGKYGAAIDMEGSGRLTITGDSVIFSNNFAKAHGGAIHGSNTNITVNTLKFTGNTAETDNGGAVNLYNGTLTLKGQGDAAQIEILGNTAGKVGGAIRGNADLSNASIRFENNKAGTFGGAIHGNSVVFSGDSTTAVFTGNSAADSGNDLYITGDAGILSFSGSGTYSFDGGIVLEKETAQTAIDRAQVTISGRENDDTNHYQLQNVSISNGGKLTVLLDQINTLTGLFSVGADSMLEVNVGDGAEKSFANSITGAGGLTKTGAGTLTLNNNQNTFTGNVVVNGGTLVASASWKSKDTTVFGDYVSKTVTVNDGAELVFAAQDVVSNSGTNSPIQFIVNGGRISNSGTVYNNLANTVFTDGAQLHAADGNATWKAYKLSSKVSVLRNTDGSAADAVTFSSDLTKANATYSFGHGTSIYVEDVTSDSAAVTDTNSDLIISAVITNPNTESNRTFYKDGAGILEFTAANTFDGTASIREGVLRLTGDGTLGTSAVAIGEAGTLEIAYEDPAKNVDISSLALAEGGTFKLTSGTVSVDGAFSAGDGSQLVFELGGTTDSSIFLASGSTLDISDDAVLELLLLEGASGTYTLIEAEDGLGDYTDAAFWTDLLTTESDYFWDLSIVENSLLATVDSNAVPEPATWALLIFGAFGVYWVRRKK